MIDFETLQNPVGAKMGPKIDQVAPKCLPNLCPWLVLISTRETLKHSETPGGLELRLVYVFRCLHFPICGIVV